jgi:ubiquinone/menaquinone biosynthesis C-methylase UbiE
MWPAAPAISPSASSRPRDGQAQGTVLDINGSMLGVGAERAAKKGYAANLDFVEANAEELPFEDASFDAYTIAFGIRNVPDIDKALREAYRVLKARRPLSLPRILRGRDAAARQGL